MPHFLIHKRESPPDIHGVPDSSIKGPVTAVNPETAIKLSDISTEPTVQGGLVEIIVYEIADDGTGKPMKYTEEDLEL